MHLRFSLVFTQSVGVCTVGGNAHIKHKTRRTYQNLSWLLRSGPVPQTNQLLSPICVRRLKKKCLCGFVLMLFHFFNTFVAQRKFKRCRRSRSSGLNLGHMQRPTLPAGVAMNTSGALLPTCLIYINQTLKLDSNFLFFFLHLVPFCDFKSKWDNTGRGQCGGDRRHSIH